LGVLRIDERSEPPRPAAGDPVRLIPAYADELLSLGQRHPELVVLDGDLMVDCGTLPFRDAFPERFVECGIAEQDMVSQAGTLALKGKIPVVHSFACFLSTRPNEHIYNNATDRSKVVYHASLAGLLPGPLPPERSGHLRRRLRAGAHAHRTGDSRRDAAGASLGDRGQPGEHLASSFECRVADRILTTGRP
jgi:hypothetical protein